MPTQQPRVAFGSRGQRTLEFTTPVRSLDAAEARPGSTTAALSPCNRNTHSTQSPSCEGSSYRDAFRNVAPPSRTEAPKVPALRVALERALYPKPREQRDEDDYEPASQASWARDRLLGPKAGPSTIETHASDPAPEARRRYAQALGWLRHLPSHIAPEQACVQTS